MDVRTTILQSGSVLLEREGIAALTQLKVARAAGVKQSHLTYYFPKRSDLLLGIAAHSAELLMSQLAARLAHAAPTVAFTEAIGAAMISGMPPRVMLGLIVAAEEEPGLRAPLTRLVRSIRARIEILLEKSGLARHDNAALLFHAAVVGLAVMHQAQHTPTSAREAKAGVAGMLALLSADGPHGAAKAPRVPRVTQALRIAQAPRVTRAVRKRSTKR